MKHSIGIVSADAGFVAEYRSALEGAFDVTVGLGQVSLFDLASGPAELSGIVLAIAPDADLDRWLDVLETSEAVVGVVVRGSLGPEALRAVIEQLIEPAPRAFDEVLAAGGEHYQCSIRDYRDKQRCLAQVVAIGEQLQLARRTVTVIEQCIDELLMNALYDAPIGEHGRPVFAGVPTATRVLMRTDATVELRCRWDRETFVVAIRDQFGALARATMLAHLVKGLRTSDPVSRRAGGAGMGLYLTVTSASAVWFDVAPGRSTDVVCTFQLDATATLGRLVFRTCRATTDRPQTTRARHALSLPTRSLHWMVRHRWISLATVAVLTMLALTPLVIHRFATPVLEVTTTPDGVRVEIEGRRTATTDRGPVRFDGLERDRTYVVRASRDGYRPAETTVRAEAGDHELRIDLVPAATVELTSTPAGARVLIGGRRVGWTPVILDDLAPGTTVTATLELDGYRPDTATLTVPAVGQRTRLDRPLVLAERYAIVHVDSEPPGAAIVRTGTAPSADRTYTPADVIVEAGVEQRFSLVMPGRSTVALPPVVATHDRPTTLRADLPSQ